MLTTKRLTATLVAVAAAVPATAAAGSGHHAPGYIFASAPGKDYSALSAPAPAPVAGSDSGFEWGDAAIGAVAALALVGVSTAGAARLRHGAA